MYLLTNGKIITEEGIIEGYDILIENDIIKKICKNGEVDSDEIEVIKKLTLKVDSTNAI